MIFHIYSLYKFAFFLLFDQQLKVIMVDESKRCVVVTDVPQQTDPTTLMMLSLLLELALAVDPALALALPLILILRRMKNDKFKLYPHNFFL